MARRASSSVNPLWLIVAAIVVAVGIGAVLIFKNTVNDPYRTLTTFPVADYMKNSNSLRGNTYKLECTVGDQLAYTDSARLFNVEIGGEPIALLIPAELREVNVQKGQRFRFKVEVGDKGVVKAVEATKS